MYVCFRILLKVVGALCVAAATVAVAYGYLRSRGKYPMTERFE